MGMGRGEQRPVPASNTTNSSFLRATVLMSLATMLSRILGLVREQLTAYYFGASQWTDVFIVASRWPGLLRDLLAEGAFSSAFVPLFMGQWQRDPEQAKVLWRSVFFWLLLLNIFIVLIFACFPRFCILLLAPEYAKDQQALVLGQQMLQLMSPVMLCMSLSALMMGTLNTMKVFFMPALAPALFNVVSVAVILLLPNLLKQFGSEPILTLAYSMTLGAVAQLVLQVVTLYRRGFFKFQKLIQLFPPGLKQLIHQLGSAFLGQVLTQGNVVLNTILVTSLGIAGAVSWLNYAFRLFFFPLGVLSVALSNSTSVYFSSHWQKGEHGEAKKLFFNSFYFSWWLCAIPTLVMVFIPQWPISILFEHGAFTAIDRAETAKALSAYGLGLSGYALMKLLMPVCYALGLHRLTVITASITLCFNLTFSWPLLHWGGHSILALATSLSVTGNSFILLYYILKHTGWKWGDCFSKSWLPLILSTLFVASGFIGFEILVELNSLFWWQKVVVFSVVVLGSYALWVAGLLWGGDETTQQSWKRFRAKFLGKHNKFSS